MISIDRVGVTVGAFLTRVADAGIIQLAQQSCAAMGAFAVERSYAVMTGGSLVACSTGTVIYVFTAVVPRPAIHTHTLVAAVDVVTRAAILAGVGHQLAFINILCAQLTCKFWFTLAVVGVDSIYTCPSILAVMTWTVINVMVTVFPCETWHTGAFVAGLSLLDAGASIIAGRWVAGKVAAFAVLACILLRALASVATDVIDARPTILAGRRVHITLIDVLFAGLSKEERRAGTDVVGLNGGALPTVGTWI